MTANYFAELETGSPFHFVSNEILFGSNNLFSHQFRHIFSISRANVGETSQ
jgi:hypothetical protein